MLACRHEPISLASSLLRPSSSRVAPSLLLSLFTTTASPLVSSTPASPTSCWPPMTTRYVVAAAPFPSISAAPIMSVLTSNPSQHPSKRTVSSRDVDIELVRELARGRVDFLFFKHSTAHSAAAINVATAAPIAAMIITTIHRSWELLLPCPLSCTLCCCPSHRRRRGAPQSSGLPRNDDAGKAAARWFGICPLSLLPETLNSASFGIDTREVGRCPTNELRARCSVTSPRRWPISGGIVPVSRLPERSRRRRWRRRRMDSGNRPEKPFPER